MTAAGRCPFTPEELREMAAADREIDATFSLTLEEWRASEARDREAQGKKPRASRPRTPSAKAKRRAYEEENREKLREQHRVYRQEHREEINAYNRAWRREHYEPRPPRPKVDPREARRRYYLRHREEILQKARERREKKLSTSEGETVHDRD